MGTIIKCTVSLVVGLFGGMVVSAACMHVMHDQGEVDLKDYSSYDSGENILFEKKEV
jgi:hypothetical protein